MYSTLFWPRSLFIEAATEYASERDATKGSRVVVGQSRERIGSREKSSSQVGRGDVKFLCLP